LPSRPCLSHSPRFVFLAPLLAGLLSAGCGSSADHGGSNATPPAVVDLRADVNRNGTVDLSDPTEDQNEDTWDAKHGAIFLANIDDDQGRCPKEDSDGTLSDVQLPQCNDAADDVVNGPDDLLDLARLKTVPWPDAPDDASGTLELSSPGADHVRLFKKHGENFNLFTPGDALNAAELRAGVEFAIEGKDIVRDLSVWDGYVNVTLHVTAPSQNVDATDTVRMREAPVLTSYNLQPAEVVYATRVAGAIASIQDPGSVAFTNDLGAAVTDAQVPAPLDEIDADDDQWTQDYFETGYMTMPAPGGKQHVINVYYRSANVDRPNDANNPLRPAGKVVFTLFRGKDAAGVQQFNANHDPDMDSLNSFGNLETIPPYTLGGVSYPFGRVIRGSIPSFHPDPTFEKMIDAQKEQPRVNIDTSWLLVGHVDETLSFVKANTARGWTVVAADPTLAKQMLTEESNAGHGSTLMFAGEKWIDDSGNETPAEISIDDVLNDTDLMAESATAAAAIDKELQVIEQATGITDSEVIRLPILFEKTMGYGLAYQPGTVNGIVLSDHDFGAPDPHGPVIDGADIFKTQMTQAFAKIGITVHFIEDWDLYHALEGEVHCGSNVLRAVPAGEKWWETGR
jgi:protein-arginine deiminase